MDLQRLQMLERARAHVGEAQIRPGLQLGSDRGGHTDAARRGNLLNALGHDQAVAIGSVAVQMHRPDVNADTEGERPTLALPGCGVGQVALDRQRKVDSRARVAEFREYAVARFVDDAAAIMAHQLPKQRPCPPQTLVGAYLILLDEDGVALDVGK